MPCSSSTFAAWLESHPHREDFAQISPARAYAHAEENYDAQYGVVTPHPEEGLGLCSLLKQQGRDLSGPAVEIGCGTGHLTTGLALGYPGEALLATDPSLSFLRMTSRRLAQTPGHTTRVRYAILNGDELSLLAADMFSLIALRSTLHHILNVDHFIEAGARALRSGGTMAMGAEPCESGYVLMGAVAQSIPLALNAAGVEMKPQWRQQWQIFSDTIRFYCRRDFDKTSAEDKHLFRVHELGLIGAKYGLHLQYFANAAFSDFHSDSAVPTRRVFFGTFFLNYLRYCMSFDPDFVELIGRHCRAQMDYVDDCYLSHAGPLFTGVFLFTKTT